MKKFFAIIIFMLMIFSTCSAKNILVTGEGSTERSAIHNAMRMAIEQELGTAARYLGLQAFSSEKQNCCQSFR